MKKYAYVRVSTKEQNIDRQLHALESFDIPKKMFIAIINQERILKDHSIRN
jgi:DNA invertase Pin-like site-specific DNA recombinase